MCIRDRIESEQPLGAAFDLWPAEGCRIVEDLAVKIRTFDTVAIDEGDRPDAGRGKVESYGRSEAPSTYDNYTCLL